MSQGKVQFPTSSPPPYPGTTLAANLNTAFQATSTFQAGTSAPTAASTGLASIAGIYWHDLSTNTLKCRNQADTAWILVGTFDETNGVFIPVSAPPEKSVALGHVVVAADYGYVLIINATGGAGSITIPRTLGSSLVPFVCWPMRDVVNDATGNVIAVYDCVSPSNTAQVNLIDTISAPVNGGQVPALAIRVNGTNVISLRSAS